MASSGHMGPSPGLSQRAAPPKSCGGTGPPPPPDFSAFTWNTMVTTRNRSELGPRWQSSHPILQRQWGLGWGLRARVEVLVQLLHHALHKGRKTKVPSITALCPRLAIQFWVGIPHPEP